MNCRKRFAILIIGMAAVDALAQPAPVTQTTVCDLVNNPLQFEGKLVQVRAQIWADTDDVRRFWMNEVAMRSGKVCHFLEARINEPTWFAGANGFGTFTGRLMHESAPLNLAAPRKRIFAFIVEQESDAYGIQYMNGTVPLLQLYDKQTGSFIKPERHSVHVVTRCGPARPAPGTSKMNVSCFETSLPANYYDVWSTMVFHP